MAIGDPIRKKHGIASLTMPIKVLSPQIAALLPTVHDWRAAQGGGRPPNAKATSLRQLKSGADTAAAHSQLEHALALRRKDVR